MSRFSPVSRELPQAELKVLIAGPLLLSSGQPSTRRDDYASAVLRKVEWLAQEAGRRAVDFVVLLGDLFLQPSPPLSFLIKCVEAFQRFTMPVYTLVGDHDLPATNLASLARRPLGVLVSCGLVEILGDLHGTRASFYLRGAHYGQVPLVLPDAGRLFRCRVVASHSVGSSRLLLKLRDERGVVDPKDLRNAGWTRWWLGHESGAAPDERGDDGAVIHRPGPLARGVLDDRLLAREVYVDALTVRRGESEVERVIVPSESPLEVFRAQETVSASVSSQIRQFVGGLGEAARPEEVSDPRRILRQLTEDEDVLAFCLRCLEEHRSF